MQHAAEFHRCMVDMDLPQARRLWAHVNPHLHQPASDGEMAIVLHHARTQSAAMPLKARAYSHRWLVDGGYPTGLPDELKPAAERIYPKIVEAVGIGVRPTSEFMKPVAKLVQSAMSDAVLDCYSDKRTEPTLVKARMMEVRARTIKQLLG